MTGMEDSCGGSAEGASTIYGVLDALTGTLVERLDADGANISRVIGELLVDLVAYSPNGRTLQLGRSFLLSDYPLTREVIELQDARTVWVHDPAADPNEVSLLRELGFESLLMLPLVVESTPWALVEIYRESGRAFGAAEIDPARELVARATARLEQLQRPAAA